jgi:hypothetical protein
MQLQRVDEDLRGSLTKLIANLGHAPSLQHLSEVSHLTPDAVNASLERLAVAHALLLHPNSFRPWVVHPFALSPGSCWVQSGSKGYWANCLYCALGILAALHSDGLITTRLGGEDETVQFRVVSGELQAPDVLFHLSTPVARWWDNVIYACSSFQPLRSEADVDAWCDRHDLPKGAILTMPQLWRFASDWYGNYLRGPWRKRTNDDIRELFARHELTGSFWSLELAIKR